MKTSVLLIVLLCFATIATAQRPTESIPLWTESVPLWTGAAPGARGIDPAKDIPTLTPFWPTSDNVTSSSAVMIICPGGGYAGLAAHEGKDYALWLNERGIAAFVLKYRLGSAGYRHPVMLNDAQRAIRLVRSHATEWEIDPKKIGIMGSSAGGHLASTALTHFDAGQANAADPIERVSSRPDLGVLCYPVISMGKWTHAGSRDNLLGKNPAPELLTLLSNELQITKETPPCFLWHTQDDNVVPIQNSLEFATALLNNKVPFELHIYQRGGHGQGLGVRNYNPGKTEPAKLLPWTQDLAYWLKLRQFTK